MTKKKKKNLTYKRIRDFEDFFEQIIHVFKSVDRIRERLKTFLAYVYEFEKKKKNKTYYVKFMKDSYSS